MTYETIDIIDFVKADAIDDRFVETPYYLVPSKGGERAYALLREAIRKSDRIGIATFILRDAQHPAAVEVVDLMERLRRSLDHSGAKPRAAKTRATKKAAAKKRKRRAA